MQTLSPALMATTIASFRYLNFVHVRQLFILIRCLESGHVQSRFKVNGEGHVAQAPDEVRLMPGTPSRFSVRRHVHVQSELL